MKIIKIASKPENDKPDIFTHTTYRLPTEADLEDIHNHPNLTADEIVQGFGYTIIGRGVPSKDNRAKIVASITLLCKKYQEVKIYQQALGKAKDRLAQPTQWD